MRERERDKGKADGRPPFRALFFVQNLLGVLFLRRGISLYLSLCLATMARERRPERWCRHKTTSRRLTNKSMCLFILQNAKWSLLFPLISSNAHQGGEACSRRFCRRIRPVSLHRLSVSFRRRRRRRRIREALAIPVLLLLLSSSSSSSSLLSSSSAFPLPVVLSLTFGKIFELLYFSELVALAVNE